MRGALEFKIDVVRCHDGVAERTRYGPGAVFFFATQLDGVFIDAVKRVVSVPGGEFIGMVTMAGDDVFEVEASGAAAAIGVVGVEIRGVLDVEERLQAAEELGRLRVVAEENGELAVVDGEGVLGFLC